MKGFFLTRSKGGYQQAILTFFVILSCWAFNSSSVIAQTVELQSGSCSVSNVAEHNTAVLERAVKSGVIIKLPAGEFQVAPFSIAGVKEGAIQGAVESNTQAPLSKLAFLGAQGISLSNTTHFQLVDLDIAGPKNSSLVVLKHSGEFSAANFRVLEQVSSSKLCLSNVMEWLVPVMHLLL